MTNSSPVKSTTISYADAGVSIEKGNQFIEKIKPLAKLLTPGKGALNKLDGFGALFDIGAMNYKDPILVSGADGVGTKLKLAIDIGKHDTIGIDLVAMCVNDILVHGAQPLFFLDYLACNELKIDHAHQVITGIANGCKLADCALVGGETAEMPAIYSENYYDLAGFCVGAVERDKMIDGLKTIQSGDKLIGIASSGPHANGYSLIRKILASPTVDLSIEFDGKTLNEVLIEPTKIYSKTIKKLLLDCQIKAMAHITGGGIPDNLPRVMPNHVKACIDRNAWERPEIFNWLQETGPITQKEMDRTFNCGIGMVVCVAKEDEETAIKSIQESGEQAFAIGNIQERQDTDNRVIFLN